jgi:hypothetical protein
MPLVTPAFARYVDAARNGRTALWRTATTAVCVFWLMSLLSLIIPLIVGAKLDLVDLSDGFGVADLMELQADPALFAIGLASAGLIWPLLWLFARRLQGRSLATVLGQSRRIAIGDFFRGAMVVILASAPGLALAVSLGMVERSLVPLDLFLLWLTPYLVALMLQTSGEELLFRGFLPQALAARYRSPFVWALLPTVVFMALHYNFSLGVYENFLLMIGYAVFSAVALLTVVRTGNLGAAMGIHFINNILAILVFSDPATFLFPSLFWTPTFLEPVPGLLDLVAAIAFAALNLAFSAFLFLHPRSPLRLRTPAPEPAPPAPVAELG